MNLPTTVLDHNDTQAYIATRALLDERQERGTLLPSRMETLHKKVSDIHTALDPQDTDRPLNQSLLRYVNGQAALAFRRPEAGTWEDPQSFTGSALSQLGYKVLGGGGTKYMESLRHEGDTGRKLAEVNWAFSLQSQTKPSLLRTIQLPGVQGRTIRAVLSGGGTGYSVIDNIDILNLFLESPEIAHLPVIEANITPDSMRLRLLLNPEDAAMFDPITGKLRNPGSSHFVGLDLPIPMIEIWNGEIGNSAVRIQWGTYFVRCLNGLMGYEGGANYRWNHSGGDDRADRIKAGLGDAIKSARVEAAGQVQDYKVATEIAVDDASALLDTWGERDLTRDQLQGAKDALQDETTYPGRKLASVVDAITLMAQGESDLRRQRDLESFAARILQKGLEKGRKDRRIQIAA